MEAKLIKKSENYYELYEVRTNLTLLIGSTDSEKKIDVYGKDAHKLLSLKNCQAIERGYDLDELAEKACPDVISSAHSAFKAGFQKALEILGNKKFSEEDVGNAIEMCIKLMNDKGSEFREHKQTVIQSLQQTEWEVEIVGSGTVYKTVLDCCANYHPKFGCSKKDGCSCINNELPKLDADGCLILKRK